MLYAPYALLKSMFIVPAALIPAALGKLNDQLDRHELANSRARRPVEVVRITNNSTASCEANAPCVCARRLRADGH